MRPDELPDDYEFILDDIGHWCIVHKHKEEDCHYPYTMITRRFYHYSRKTCIRCKKRHPKHLLLLRELMK